MLDPRVHAALEALAVDFEMMDCDPELADTAAFCVAYRIDPADSANTILIKSKRPEGHLAATVVLATHRLDVNRAVRDAMSVSKVSFADAETTIAATGMMIGGVTPFGLPADLPVLVDADVLERGRIILGGGNRSSKLAIRSESLLVIPAVRVIPGLARPIEV
jgi:prolyl-tRNA editing enzyme YbaK/EbsC (Cys-tRNA(Pro) deacylase)